MTTSIDGKLSLILPAHNEEGNLERVLGHSVEVLNATVPDWEVLVINDGSTDATGEIAEKFASREPRIRVVHHPRNRGYGSAWRTGFSDARGEYLMCMDSDGQFDLQDISALLPYVNHYDIVAGYRVQRQDALYRKINAYIFHTAARWLFGVRVRDVDCGFKIFRSRFIKELDLRAPGALINLEILGQARLRRATIVQVGVSHYPRQAGSSSGAKPSVVIQAMKEILVLRLRLWKSRLTAGRAVWMAAAGGGILAAAALVGRRLRRG